MRRIAIAGSTLTASFDAEASGDISRALDEALVVLFCAAAGVPRATAAHTHHRAGSEDDPVRTDEWRTPTGAALRLTGTGICSPHGVHGEDLAVAVTGLPAHVVLRARASIDHRRGGALTITLEGCDGLAALARQLEV